MSASEYDDRLPCGSRDCINPQHLADKDTCSGCELNKIKPLQQ